MKTALQTVNPWRGEGVSIIPDDLAGLMPLVGQENLFRRLDGFRREILDKPHRDALAGFFLVIGGWGVGKSRIGHEVCLEAVTDEIAWIVDSQPLRLLQPGLAEGILPLFVRYSQVTTGPLGDRLEVENWIPRVALESLSRLAGLRPSAGTNQPLKNQDRLLALARKALRAKPGWDTAEPRLRKALAEANPDKAVRQSLVVLRELGVEHLWIVVDEIEDITDVERDGLNPGDREGIDQALLTVIPRVIKQEEVRQEFPQINFLLLCSQAVGNNLQGIKAIERRTGWYPMASNSFADVEAFFQYLRTHRPTVYQGMASYPQGLKEAAFFAANRNFGWFNVIMYQAHQNHRGGQLGVPEILKKFAAESPRGHKGSVFDLDQISPHWLPHDGDFPQVERLLFGLLPPAIGTGAGEVVPADAQRLLAITHLGNEGRPLFTRLVEVKPPARHLITAHLVSCGFKNPEGNDLHLPGESRFNIQEVLDSLQAYSIALPADRRQHLLLPERLEEFTEQVRALSPYADEAERFAPYLHGLLTLPEYRQRDGSKERAFLAPAFSFLQRFHRLNKLRRADVGYLRDDRKNTRLKDACEALKGAPRDQHQTQLRGLAFAWEQKLVPCEPLADARLPTWRVVTTEDPRNPAWNPLHVAADHRVSLLWAGGAEEADLLADLQRLAREPLHPIVAVFEGGEQQAAELRQRLARIAPAVAPSLIVYALGGPEAELLLAYGLLGQEFAEEDLKTRYFAGGIEMARQRLDQAAKVWRQRAEDEGLVLRPIFPGRAAKDDELQALARGFAAMLGGASYNALLQSPTGVFAYLTERDLFRKAAERHVDPGPKYREHPTLGLLTDQAGEYAAQVPRPLLTLTERCGGVARTRGDLERQFFFALPPDTRPSDAVRQLCRFLDNLGLLEPEGEKFRRAQVTSLVAACERGLTWLDGEFARKAQEVRAVHQEPGEALLNRHAKQARHDLNEARKRLQHFSLDFLSEKWSELEKPGSDGQPLFVSRFQSALAVLAQVHSTAEQVYDPDAQAAFQYAPEGLEDFETQSLQPGYPLWRRVAVLAGFYAELARRRQVLLKAISDGLDESDRRVPASASGGEKLFPTQALALPLGLYRQELEFTPDAPQRTVTGWGATHATNSLGFKLHSGKYHEARQRLEAIEREIAQPGGLVDRYRRALASWEEVVAAHAGLASQVESLFAFFADAPAPIRESFGLAEVRRQEEELGHVATGGGMREGTDGRESAGTPALQLIDGLEEDVAQVRGLPGTLAAQIASVENSVLVVLTEEYNARHKAPMNAHVRVREAQRLPALTTWPQARAETYLKTVGLFDSVVRRAEQDGAAYLPEGGPASFRDFVALCGQDLAGREIDWDDSAVDRMLPVLKEKKLVRLRLI